MIDAVADWTERFGSAPRLLDWSPALAHHAGRPELAELFDSERPRYPTASRVRQLFGSWHAALGAAEHRSTQSGLKRCSPRAAASAPATHTTAWTQDEALEALRAHHRRHGQAPLYEQWAAADPTGARPSTPTVLALCGSWNEALRQAGLAIRRHQPGRRADPAARRAAVQRYLDGESSTTIAADLGATPPPCSSGCERPQERRGRADARAAAPGPERSALAIVARGWHTGRVRRSAIPPRNLRAAHSVKQGLPLSGAAQLLGGRYRSFFAGRGFSFAKFGHGLGHDPRLHVVQ